MTAAELGEQLPEVSAIIEALAELFPGKIESDVVDYLVFCQKNEVGLNSLHKNLESLRQRQAAPTRRAGT